MYVSALPIPTVPTEKQKPVERLVERILSVKRRDAGADVSELERELDELVYALFGLTPEEISIVEGEKCMILMGKLMLPSLIYVVLRR